jgi:hypothetical protein
VPEPQHLEVLRNVAHGMMKGDKEVFRQEIDERRRLGSHLLPPACCRVTDQTGDMACSTRRQCACLDCSVFSGKPCLAVASGWRCSLCEQRGCEGSKASREAYKAAEAKKAAAEAEVSPPNPTVDPSRGGLLFESPCRDQDRPELLRQALHGVRQGDGLAVLAL